PPLFPYPTLFRSRRRFAARHNSGVMTTEGKVMKTSNLFNDKADLYASSRPTYPKELFDYIATLVESHNEAWDCATGNGQAALGLSRTFSVVEASDISKEQIKNAFPAKNILS